MNHVESSVQVLQGALGPAVRAVETFRGETTLVIEPSGLKAACARLRGDPELGFELLAALTASDHWPQEPRFAVVYQFYHLARRCFLGLRVPLPGDAAELPSIESIYPNANWHERELYDMFGIRFSGHSDLRRILMPYDWQGHPLRKDYPLGYEEVQFSFNHQEIDRRKPYARA